MKLGMCRHCKKRAAGRSRRLCNPCRKDPVALALFPAKHRGGPAPEPTMEELDRIEAEQRKKLPKWWHDCQPRSGLKESLT
jgi:hypothetical protein